MHRTIIALIAALMFVLPQHDALAQAKKKIVVIGGRDSHGVTAHNWGEGTDLLVKALKSKHDIIRKTAIECLYEIYGRTLLYRHNAPQGHRNERYRKWLKEIDKLRK